MGIDRENKVHKRVRAKLRRLIREMEQTIRDVEWWNRNRPGEPPLDCEPEQIVLAHARRCLAACNAGLWRDVDRLVTQILETLGTADPGRKV